MGSLIDLSNLGKPATALINKISEGVGTVFEPKQIRRLARAKADAAVIAAEGEIRVQDAHRRALHRWVEEESQRQRNIENITAKALPQLGDSADPQAMDTDWLTNFFDKSRIVTDDEMQNLWSRILAGEATSPGSFSRRTVNCVADIDKPDATLFTMICGFSWHCYGRAVPLVFDLQANIYDRNNLTFESLSHLDSIGLLKFDHLAGFNFTPPDRAFRVSYFDESYLFEIPENADREVQVGHVMLTQLGAQLAPINGSVSVDGLQEYVLDRWKKYGMQRVTVASLEVDLRARP